MRVISGALGGREFASPRGHTTHPMGDKQRGALFNILGDITGLTVLDTYAGSGALSFEALSRGAASSTMIESDKQATRAITENIQTLGLGDKATLTQANCVAWSKRHPREQFDLVFCDPPYDAVLIRDIQQLGSHVKPGGILVLSWPAFLGVDQLEGFEVLRDRTYAKARLVFYRKIS